MSKKGKDYRPYLPPVTKIELSEKNIRQRWILTVVLILIAAVSIAMGIHYALDVQPGWNPVSAVCDEPNYSSEFQLMYDFSQTGGDAAAINKELSALYSQVMEDAYRLFSKDAELEGVRNLHYLSRHVNEPVKVEPALYNVLVRLTEYENRCIFLAPVYVEYNRVFNAESDGEAVLYDPAFSEETADYIRQLMTYLADSDMIGLEFPGGDQVVLKVSPEYLAFAEENGITEFLDLGWMRNAFVADYAADKLLEKGFSSGYLVSFDGYSRYLSEKGQPLDFIVYDRQGRDIYAPGRLTYDGKRSMVYLRDYPLGSQDRWSYHVYEDGTVTSTLIDPASGISRSAAHNLVGYARDLGCADILLEMAPVFFGDSLTAKALAPMKDKGIYSIWCEEFNLCYNEAGLEVALQENKDGVRYAAQYRES